MNERRGELLLQPVLPTDGGFDGDRWIARWDEDETPAYDGCGPTVEDALVALIFTMGEALEEQDKKIELAKTRMDAVQQERVRLATELKQFRERVEHEDWGHNDL